MAEPALSNIYPFGDLENTLIDENRMKELDEAYRKRDFKDNVINVPLGKGKSKSVGEEDIIEHVVKRVKYQYDFAERNIELVGCNLDMNLLKGFAHAYREASGTPTGTIKPKELAKTDDLVLGFMGPRYWNAIAGAGNEYSFEITGLTTGDNPINIVDSGGLASGQTGDLDIDNVSGWNPWLFFTGDWLDLNADSIITEVQYSTVDDEDYGPTPMYVSERASDLHYMLTPGMLVKDSLNIDATAAKSGDHELVPICFFIDSGSQVITL